MIYLICLPDVCIDDLDRDLSVRHVCTWYRWSRSWPICPKCSTLALAVCVSALCRVSNRCRVLPMYLRHRYVNGWRKKYACVRVSFDRASHSVCMCFIRQSIKINNGSITHRMCYAGMNQAIKRSSNQKPSKPLIFSSEWTNYTLMKGTIMRSTHKQPKVKAVRR